VRGKNHKKALRVFFMAVLRAVGKMGTTGDRDNSYSDAYTNSKIAP